ncbi:hypothetical protein Tco_0555499 [Tanacetum coccineum]
MVFHNEDGNPARANIKQALGSFKGGDGDGDGDTQFHAQDGNTLQDDERLDLTDDLMKAQVHNQRQCMTRSSTNKLFTPYKEPEQEFRSSRRHFKSLSLDELRSPDFNLFSDQEYSEEEEAEAMAETMEQYMSKTQTDYGSGVARPKIEEKDSFELKG